MSSTTGEVSKLSSPTSHTCHQFSLAEIRSATNNFEDELVIGKGGYGKVYKGRICIEENIHVVAIKRLDSMSEQGAPEFRAEIAILSKLRHRHLVSLIGFCDDNEEMILVYEYIPNGTLYHHLHKSETPLNWVRRLKIAIGAASGLEFLHSGVSTQQGVMHRDIKSSNILLDGNWEAMISDFGLSKIGLANNQSFSDVDMSVSVKGTFGYLDPEYFYTRRLTRKTDVFAFGVVLFELLSGRLAVDIRLGEEQCSLVKWARKCVEDRKLDQLVDSSIRGTIFPKCLRRFAQIADRCLYPVPKERPSMTEVVASLQVLLELHEKYDNSTVSSGKMRFAWKIHNYLVPMDKQIGSTSSQKSLENNTNQELVTRDLKKFTYGELQRATRNFGDDSRLGDGHYAKVHKGWIDKDDSGLAVAIKTLHRYNNLNLEMLKEFRHPNLVKLLGYCSECEQLFLVYEFMPNGNLQDGLHSGAVAQLPLDTKVKIAVGIARAVVFLNKIRDKVTVSEPRLQRHKILLDEEFTAKLSDYDISKLVDGDYTGEPSELECNLSGFTVVFAEVLTGKQISNEKEFKKDDSLWLERLIAKVCFEICNKGNSERQMLKVVEKYMNSKPVL